jgi:uncharacterized protein YaaN involved in tellurite resistance
MTKVNELTTTIEMPTVVAPEPVVDISMVNNQAVATGTFETAVVSPAEQMPTPTAVLNALTPMQLEKAKAIARDLNLQDSKSVMKFGYQSQQKLEAASDQLLRSTNGSDNEEIARMITHLMSSVNEVMPDDIAKARKAGLFPWAKKKAKQRMLAMQVKAQTIEGSISQFKGQLENQHDKLLNNNVILTQQYESLRAYAEDLKVEVAAGELKLQEIDNVLLPELERKAAESNDQFLVQDVMRLKQVRGDLAAHVDGLLRSQQFALIQCNQVLVLQNGNFELAKKLQEATFQIIPIWKSQMTISLMLLGAENALKQLDVVTETTDKLLRGVATQVKETGVSIARKSKESALKMETLRHTHAEVLEAVRGITEVTNTAEAKRREASAELRKNQDQLLAILKSNETVNPYIEMH